MKVIFVDFKNKVLLERGQETNKKVSLRKNKPSAKAMFKTMNLANMTVEEVRSMNNELDQIHRAYFK